MYKKNLLVNNQTTKYLNITVFYLILIGIQVANCQMWSIDLSVDGLQCQTVCYTYLSS